MSDAEEAARQAEEKAREQREADLVKNRIEELHEEPIKGNFDADHLKAVHAYIFQDFPKHQPGIVRDDTAETWIKHRSLEGKSVVYNVPYVSQGVEAAITAALDQFGGADAIKGSTPEAAAGRLAELYGNLDHAHGFYEGNSRILREFTRELAQEAGFTLDWTQTGGGIAERNALYVARDLAVLERTYPDLTPEKAMQTNDRAEYEASFVIEALRREVGDKSLTAIIRDRLTPAIQLEQAQRQEAAPVESAEAVAAVSETHVGAVVQQNPAEATTEPPQPAELGSTRKPDRVEEFLKAEHGDREARKAALQELAREYGQEVNQEEGAEITRDRGDGHSL